MSDRNTRRQLLVLSGIGLATLLAGCSDPDDDDGDDGNGRGY